MLRQDAINKSEAREGRIKKQKLAVCHLIPPFYLFIYILPLYVTSLSVIQAYIVLIS
jgi:hypothetical protein